MRKPPAEKALLPETHFLTTAIFQKIKFDLQSSQYDEKTGDLQHECLHRVSVSYAPSPLSQASATPAGQSEAQVMHLRTQHGH